MSAPAPIVDRRVVQKQRWYYRAARERDHIPRINKLKKKEKKSGTQKPISTDYFVHLEELKNLFCATPTYIA